MTHYSKKMIIPDELAGNRLDLSVAKIFPEFSRNRIKSWIKDGSLLVNGEQLRPRDIMNGGEMVSLQTVFTELTPNQAEPIPLDIRYEDEQIAVINKPVGLVVHPGAGNLNGTLMNGLLHQWPHLNELPRAGIVHRLDKETSGLMVVAKTHVAHSSLVRQLEKRQITRQYDAICNGVLTGGGVINSGPKASELLRELVRTTGFPITSTLQGLGSYPGEDSQFLGMLGMHGTYEANNAMHDCDLLINIGARFDDRITGKIDEFSPKSKKVHIDIDPSSINKIIKVDLAIVGDVTDVIKSTTKTLKKKNFNLQKSNKQQTSKWWQQIQKWRTKQSLNFINSDKIIKPQHAVQRLYELTKHQDTFITTEVGQHQMWAAQHYKFNKPNRWMTSGGLGTMGYGLPAAVGVQVAHPKKLVIDVAGEASILMTMQEISTAVQYNLPIKIFILNNQYMGMVRQWQELLHEKNYSESYSEALPDFVKLAEAYGCVGIRAENPDELDEKIQEMIDIDRPVIFDCHVDQAENCFPMIPSGKPHNQMLLGPKDQEENKITGKGKALV